MTEQYREPVDVRIGNHQIVELFGGKLETFAEFEVNEQGGRLSEEPIKILMSLEQLREEIAQLEGPAGANQKNF